jgi:hypothetical protein
MGEKMWEEKIDIAIRRARDNRIISKFVIEDLSTPWALSFECYYSASLKNLETLKCHSGYLKDIIEDLDTKMEEALRLGDSTTRYKKLKPGFDIEAPLESGGDSSRAFDRFYEEQAINFLEFLEKVQDEKLVTKKMEEFIAWRGIKNEILYNKVINCYCEALAENAKVHTGS